ncbi:MAG: ATP-binding protein, partial [Bradymonadaceae bacterium]
ELEGTPIGRLIRRACEKDPQARFVDAADLLDGFVRAMQEMSVQPAPMGASRPDIAVSYIVPQDHVSPAAPAESSVVTSAPAQDSGSDVDDTQHAPLAHPAPLPPEPVKTPRLNSLSAVKKGPPDVPERRRVPSLEDRAHSRPRYELPLVGRDAEFEKVSGLIRDASEMSTGHYLLLEGESGLGKSHLVGAVLRGLTDDDLTISLAHFRRRSSPLEALRDLISGIWGVSHAERLQVDKVVRQDLKALGGFTDGEIGFFVEFLRPRTAEGGEAISPEAGTLYARLERLLLRLCERRPLVLVLEDLQYADSASLAFLEYFAVTLRTHAVPVVIVLTLRPEERGLNPDLEQSLRTISANVGVGFSRLRLRRLRGRDLAVLLDAIVPLEARLKERIGWLCQGVPMHAMQIIRYLQNEGNLVRQGKRWALKSGSPRKIDLPPDLMELMALRVEQAIQKRTERPDLRLILQWLSILGMRTPVELLAMVLHQAEKRNTETLDQDLKALTEEGIVRQALHQNLICVEFDNSLLREALLSELKEQWSRARLH